jgi:multidrug efflux system membrane fusion protein
VQGELAAGERVVTDGADRLREGAKVEVITPAPRPSGQGAAASQPPGPDDSARPARTAGPPLAAALPQPGTPASRAPAGKPQVVEAPAPVSAAPSGASWIDQLPPEAQERARAAMQRLPPDAAERVGKMSPDERRAFFRQLRERREQ